MTDRPTPERIAAIRADAIEWHDPSRPYAAVAGRRDLLIEIEFLTAERDAARAELAEIRDRFAIESDESVTETVERTIRAATRCTERAEKAEAALGRAMEALNKIAAWHDGPHVTGSFDEPYSAQTARDALSDPTGAKALKLWQAMRSVVAAAYGCVYSTDEISGLCDCLAALEAIEAEEEGGA